ncbi:MAG: tetraacyldisaccharide 4'-kinase [Colwellia sp.]
MRLIEKVWFQKHSAKWLLVPILLPLTCLFWLLSGLRRLCYKLKFFKSYKVNKPVIVVGNIGIGGNGKTPVVVCLVEQAKKIGFKPGVISRGYGGTPPEQPYLLSASSTSIQAGDEPVLIYNRCKVPVAVGSNRIDNANLLIEQGCDLIISDDGLQHYRLQRDLEIIVIDGKRFFGNGLLLPAGPLREGTWRLSDVDLLIINGGESQVVNAKLGSFEKLLMMKLLATEICHVKSGKLISVAEFLANESLFKQISNDTVNVKAVNAIAGIGAPQRFFDTLKQLGFGINLQKGFVDHQDFVEKDFEQFSSELPLLMTEKDAVKCTAFAQEHWWYLPVEASFSSKEETQLISMLSNLKCRKA